jgi:hypothetical protein
MIGGLGLFAYSKQHLSTTLVAMGLTAGGLGQWHIKKIVNYAYYLGVEAIFM